MVKRVLCVFGAMMIGLLCGAALVHAESAARIMTLPFEIHSPTDLSYLKTQVPWIIAGQLEKDGGVIVDADKEAIDPTRPMSADEARRLGQRAGADYVIWGSLTRPGRRISLDVKLLAVSSETGPEYLYAEGEDIENLLSTVNAVALDIGTRVFGFESIAAIEIRGNERIETDAVLRVIKAKPGDRFQKAVLSEDLKSIFAMGYFEDIRIEAERSDAGTRVVFTVQEKPTVHKVKIKGNSALDSEKILKEVTITPGSILNSFKIKSNIRQIESLYQEKHYHNTKVTYKTYPRENNQADLEFVIDEGEKVLIKTITFEGASAFTDKKLKKMMKTKEKGFFSWLTSSGVLDTADLNTDVAAIGAEYQRQGYIDVRIAEPVVEYEGNWIFVTVKIDEGPRYKTGTVGLSGDMLESRDDLLARLSIPKQEYCNREIIQQDVMTLTDMYSDKGYAAASIYPRLSRNPDTLTADVEFEIRKGDLVHFDRIVIGGNLVTRDKVIRRQLQVHEKELFSGTKMKRSVRNLYRMDYFEDVKVSTQPGSEPNTMDLIIDVTEKPTGTFTFGMGYSSQDKLFGTLAVAKRNLFGRDQTLNIQGEFGDNSNKYSMSFIEPWLFDIPLSAQIQFMNWEREYDYYDKQTLGGSLKFGYPVFDYTRLYVSYAYEINDISNIQLGADYTTYLLQGEYTTRSAGSTLHYDSRDRAYNAQATRGTDSALSVEYAGGPFGGDISFTKYKLTMSRYFPLISRFIGHLHGEGGYVRENSDGILPPYEKFFLGGMNSIRGFGWNDICLKEPYTYIGPDGPVTDYVDVGGEKYVQFNVELLRPLFSTEGFLGLVFFDAGNVYAKDSHVDFDHLRRSWGFGIRWFSPIGPIRFERGYIIDPRPGEPSSGKWDFTMGGTF
ncbi:outer membrane protein assembly factor BamA [Desulfatiferula olefinivorans]